MRIGLMIKYFKVFGRVQGVGYRASTLNMARQLDIAGWVRNCSDGAVETVAQGDSEQLQLFENWLNSGPPMARVDDVTVIELTEAHPSFQTYTEQLAHPFKIIH